MKKLAGIETKEGFYISLVSDQNSFYKIPDTWILDGGDLDRKPSFHQQWLLVEKIPSKIEKPKAVPSDNYRYELSKGVVEIPGIPKVIPSDEFESNEEYLKYKSLYTHKCDHHPNIIEEVEFEYKQLTKVESLGDPSSFKYSYEDRSGYVTKQKELTRNNIEHQLIDQILFPNILLPLLPCKLSSSQLYNIIRDHVKNNIDPQQATITSDYNFCFTVKKKIKMLRPRTYKVDVNIFTKRKPKYEKRVQKFIEETVFEMTSDRDKYKGYTVLPGLEANSEAELKEKLDNLLDYIMEVINTPYEQCPHCEGQGVFVKKVNTKELTNE